MPRLTGGNKRSKLQFARRQMLAAKRLGVKYSFLTRLRMMMMLSDQSDKKKKMNIFFPVACFQGFYLKVDQ